MRLPSITELRVELDLALAHRRSALGGRLSEVDHRLAGPVGQITTAVDHLPVHLFRRVSPDRSAHPPLDPYRRTEPQHVSG
jgi:hypothetical protein